MRHQENYMKKARGGVNNQVPGPQVSKMTEVNHMISQSTGLQELESRAVHLRMKEDEHKLSFNRTTANKPGSIPQTGNN